MSVAREFLTTIYEAFNARDIDAVLSALHPDVDWPNGWEGGRVHGRDGVREYWTRQWAAIDPSVEPLAFDEDEIGRTVVTVRTVIRDLEGSVVHDATVRHAYSMDCGLIRKMEILGE